MTTPSGAVVLADEYVLTHKSYFDASGAACCKTDSYPRPQMCKTVGEVAQQKSGNGTWRGVF